jgi:hypothetical protein
MSASCSITLIFCSVEILSHLGDIRLVVINLVVGGQAAGNRRWLWLISFHACRRCRNLVGSIVSGYATTWDLVVVVIKCENAVILIAVSVKIRESMSQGRAIRYPLSGRQFSRPFPPGRHVSHHHIRLPTTGAYREVFLDRCSQNRRSGTNDCLVDMELLPLARENQVRELARSQKHRVVVQCGAGTRLGTVPFCAFKQRSWVL